MATFTSNNATGSHNEINLTVDPSSVPSGFVLKLYQMVNEAPDDVITWLPSGDSFRISNLKKLENETLPTFFRHRRFQSLVRQLNFYNFRKVNRERTFWVYRHQLFHRDRPQELHLLRRRTCPGLDGRKQRMDNETTTSVRSYSPRPTTTGRRNSISPMDDQSDESVVLQSTKNKRKVHSFEDTETRKSRRKSSAIDRSETESDDDEEDYDSATQIKLLHSQESPSPTCMVNVNLIGNIDSISNDTKSGIMPRIVSPNIFAESAKRDRTNSFEQSKLVSQVAKKLEEHARKKGYLVSRRNGSVSPDTMKYHALTYDDEIEIYDSDRSFIAQLQTIDVSNAPSDESASIVSNDEEIEEVTNGSDTHSDFNTNFSLPPVEDRKVVSDIMTKLHGWARQCAYASKVDGQLTASIAGFCMMTNPQDEHFEEKSIKLLFQCGSLVTEFRRYKVALLPGSLPFDCGFKRQPHRLDVQIHELFNGDKINTIRAFKVFLLNIIEDLVNNSTLMSNLGLSIYETDCINHCYQNWLTCLRYTA